MYPDTSRYRPSFHFYVYRRYAARDLRGVWALGNARIVVIVGALFAVLFSAFAAERLRVCHGDRRCLAETMPGLLPAARFFMVRPAPPAGPPAGPPAPARADDDASPRPLP